MANMREIRTRMRSIQDTMKITNAMYLISSAKLKKARRSMEGTKPYFDTLKATIHDILLHSPDIQHAYFDNRPKVAAEEKKRGYIIITADKGLAGAYNHNVIKLAGEEMSRRGKNNMLYLIGQVGRQHFAEQRAPMPDDFFYTNHMPTRLRARSIAEAVVAAFDRKELDEVYIVYTRMVSSMKAEPDIMQLLPLSRVDFVSEWDVAYKRFAAYSPSPGEVMSRLVPNYVKGIIFGAMVEAFSAEQQCRMTAMKSATDNAGEMLRDLSLLYNRARQAAITQEITEVVSGSVSEE